MTAVAMRQSEIPAGLPQGTWLIDPSHSHATFSVRHAGIARVRGTVDITDGLIVVGHNLVLTSVTATLDGTTVSTGDPARDEHLRSSNFFDTRNHPEWWFSSNVITVRSEGHVVTGFLGLNGVTRSVDLATRFEGTAVDPFGALRAGFSASTRISRRTFNLTWNSVLETGGVLVADDVPIQLEISAVARR